MIDDREYLLKRHIECPVCESRIEVISIKSGKVVRTESDIDLRPRNTAGFDSLKYGVYSCNNCGYTALSRTFEEILRPQKALIREQITPNFTPMSEPMHEEYSYDEAIHMHKIALVNALAKHGKMSEKAYNALLIAWLYRGKREQLESEQETADEALIEECRRQEMSYLGKAYDGFIAAIADEMPPFVGMDMITTEYLMAALAWETENFDDAARLISQVLTDKGANSRVKNKALLLKEDIITRIRGTKA